MSKRAKAKGPAGAVYIKSVPDFLTELERLPPKEDFVLFFRGHSNFAFPLLPSVYRNAGWIENEDVMFRELILRCSHELDPQASTFETLVKMQHYSLPTRLLDITANPLIALFFACHDDNQQTENGEVVVFRVPTIEIKYFDSDTVSVIANVSRCPAEFKLPGRSLTRALFNEDAKIHHLLHEIKKEKPYFEPYILRHHLESVICVKPKLNNARIIKQDGAFLLFGISRAKLQSAQVPMNYTRETRDHRILVAAKDKQHVMKQLDALGINPGTLYPEIETVARQIKATYRSS